MITLNDYYAKYIRSRITIYLRDYRELKKLSEINKYSNIFVKNETKIKHIVYEKRNKYNCDMSSKIKSINI